MAALSLAYSVDVVSVQCADCGVIFGIPSDIEPNRRRDHKSFYCPNGHSQFFPSESDVERAERLLKEEQARHQRTIARENEERKAREKAERNLKRVKDRVNAGVCPECNRTFQNLARHMHCKHGTGTDAKIGKTKLP
jgi:hypothetical protein